MRELASNEIEQISGGFCCGFMKLIGGALAVTYMVAHRGNTGGTGTGTGTGTAKVSPLALEMGPLAA